MSWNMVTFELFREWCAELPLYTDSMHMPAEDLSSTHDILLSLARLLKDTLK